MADKLNILLVGSGGREHALAVRIAASPLTARLVAAPGNAGIAEVAECVAIPADDVSRLVDLAVAEKIDFVVVGPEVALVAGLADRLAEKAITAFGPSAAAAALEGSKAYMKDIVAKYGIPTAAYRRFTDGKAAKAYVAQQGAPIVIKADGLAAGKGVTVAQTIEEANTAIDEALVGGRFGAAGEEIVVEEFMTGEEASYFALVDGETVVPLGAAQDHKAVGDGDTGPNTGGMGAYSPAPVITADLEKQILDDIIRPLANAMVAEGRPYRGVIFAGLMIADSKARLIEINVRFGDPECQVLMARLESDPVDLMLATAQGRLGSQPPARWRDVAALTVVLCAEGYPGTPKTGTEIKGIAEAGKTEGVTVLHAGTKRDAGGRLLASGGRVLNVVATGRDVAEAQVRAYRAVDRIDWPEGFCRHDIGWRAIARETVA
ncbi:MAG TPA: phosphoribosylamine--glycine ligase [Alphaproteobacteria bacterium]|nr:phosphoribosylamine--glycine ligase [Alphaproteobacteria bacterium]